MHTTSREFLVTTEDGDLHQPGPVIQGIVEAIVEHHEAYHPGPFRFCFEHLCHETRQHLGGDL